jgi:PAP2 superfamily
LVDLFPSEKASFDSAMESFGYDPNDSAQEPSDPANIGKTAANAVLAFRHHDRSNQLADLNSAAPYSDYTGYQPVNTPSNIIDPDHWQPLLVNGNVQKFITPHWGMVKPYALASGKQYRALMSPPASYKKNPKRYAVQAKQVLEYTAHLTDEKKAIAEYWADGPKSELPPGHWTLFAKHVSVRDKHNLDKDVKLFFALTNAIFDASITCWDSKRFYDSVRPITAIHFLYAGQKVKSWNGALVDGANWQPYQVASFPTPPFPEYASGHSVFSMTGAETLKLFTGSDNFDYGVTLAKGSSLVQPKVSPATAIELYWATFTDAAEEAGMSRRYGGIHFVDADLNSRKIGRLVARQAWAKSLQYFGVKK